MKAYYLNANTNRLYWAHEECARARNLIYVRRGVGDVACDLCEKKANRGYYVSGPAGFVFEADLANGDWCHFDSVVKLYRYALNGQKPCTTNEFEEDVFRYFYDAVETWSYRSLFYDWSAKAARDYVTRGVFPTDE